MLFTIVTLMVLATSAAAVPTNITARHSGVQVIRNCYNQGEVAMTFDDSCSLNHDEFPIAEAVSWWGGRGTFFITGKNRETSVCIYDRVQVLKYLYKEGHILAAHTWSHPYLTELNEVEINQELAKVETAMIKILGVKPKYFRPPHGAYNDLVLKVLSERGYTKLLLWTDDTQDWDSALHYQKGVINSVANQYPNPRMLLQHPTFPYTVEAVRYAAEHLAKRGYKLVTVDQCTGGGGAYTYVGPPQAPDSTWVC